MECGSAFVVPNTTLIPTVRTPLSDRGVVPQLSPNRRPRPRPHRAGAVTMLRVQKKRRPEDWEERKSSLSGRFLPMDPRDEAVLDVLEGSARGHSRDLVPPTDSDLEEAGLTVSGPRKWSKRSEAARKRWSDPEYRAKMLAKRAEKRRRDRELQEKEEDHEQDKRLEIGVMDSITLSDESKAQAINAYAKSNKLRSEKITAFHRNRKAWMEERLQDSPQNLTDAEYINKKLERQENRRQAALKRARLRKMKKKSQASDGESGSTENAEDMESEEDVSTDS